jgi:hypothetical protein
MLIWAWAWVGRPWLASQLNDWWVAAQQLSRTAQLSWDPCGFQCTQQKRLLDAWPSRPWAPLPFSPALTHLPARVHVLYYHRLARPCPALPAFVESCCWSNCKGRERERESFWKGQQQNMQAELSDLRRVLNEEDAAAGAVNGFIMPVQIPVLSSRLCASSQTILHTFCAP